MTKTYLANAFSLSMIPEGESANFNSTPIPKVMAEMFLRRDPFQSFVGHANTAAILTNMLGVEVTMNRGDVTLNVGDELIVAQYKGPRLPEGATSLPEGARIDFLLVTRFPIHAI